MHRFCVLSFVLVTVTNLFSQNNPLKNDSIPDMLFEYRLEKLSRTTPVPLDYNNYVRSYIDIFTSVRKDEFSKIIGLSELYFPFFDQMLDKYHLPLELKYLTIVESGLNPFAVSKSGATGMWQFLLNSCKMFDLEVNSYIDERRDIYKSTEAACRYFTYLYSIFNDWQLVLASYNGGPGEVRKAIERAGGATGYWQIRPFLSEQAQGYVPAFIAVAYLMNYYKEHDITPVQPGYVFSSLDTLHIHYGLSFIQISEMIGFEVDSIRYLNPVYKTDFIPEMEHPAILVLPSAKALKFIKKESEILGNRQGTDDYHTILKKNEEHSGKIKIVHVVEKGDFFHKIAMKYNCSPENIKSWNNLNDNYLVPGQKLIIWVDKSVYERTL